jgi:hypothetical protein
MLKSGVRAAYEGAGMKKGLVVALTVALLSLPVFSAGCGKSSEQTSWVTLMEDEKSPTLGCGVPFITTQPFQLTGAPCRLRYETSAEFNALFVYLVSEDEPAERELLLEGRVAPKDGEITVDAEPGWYSLRLENLTVFRWHLWVEEQR